MREICQLSLSEVIELKHVVDARLREVQGAVTEREIDGALLAAEPLEALRLLALQEREREVLRRAQRRLETIQRELRQKARGPVVAA